MWRRCGCGGIGSCRRLASSLSPALQKKLRRLRSEYDADPGRHASEPKHAALVGQLAACQRRLESFERELIELRAMGKDPDAALAALARDEVSAVAAKMKGEEDVIRETLLGSVIDEEESAEALELQLRAAAGGSEAGLFAFDLFEMYRKHCDRKRWQFDVVTFQADNIGGTSISEAVARIEGPGAYAALMWEGGVHRVQRVPATEKSGRIHTSTATVVVLPEMPPVDLRLEEKDVRVTPFRVGGPGGQNVDKSNSGCRVTHLPTGLTATIGDERSFTVNRTAALQVLAARVANHERRRLRAEKLGRTKAQQGTGDRSEKIRTYNYPASRVVDHRSGLTLQNLAEILHGNLDELVEAMRAKHREEQLEAWTEAD